MFLFRLCIFACVVVFISPTVCSQSLSYGIKAGTNWGSVVGPIEEGGKGRLKFYPDAGLFLRWQFAERWYLQPELRVARKGADYSLPTKYDSLTVDVGLQFPIRAPYKSVGLNGFMKMSYLNVPLMFAYRYSRRAELLAGFELGYLLQAQSQLTQDSIIVGDYFLVYTDSISDLSAEFRRMDYAATLGGNFWLNQRFHLNMRTTCSVRSIYRKELEQLEANFLNFFIFVGLGYTFK